MKIKSELVRGLLGGDIV